MTLNELIARLQVAAPTLGEMKVRYVVDMVGDMTIPHYDWDNLEEAMNIRKVDEP